MALLQVKAKSTFRRAVLIGSESTSHAACPADRWPVAFASQCEKAPDHSRLRRLGNMEWVVQTPQSSFNNTL